MAHDEARTRRLALRLVAALTLIGVTLFGVPAAAEPDTAGPSASELAVARRLYSEAVELEQREEWKDAELKLREALAIKETPGLRFHAAHCQQQQGKLVEALVDYDRAAELLASGIAAPDVAERIKPAREAVRSRIPTLTIVVPTAVQNVSLQIDGKPLAATLRGKPIPLNPGSHRIALAAVGRKPFAAELALAEGETRTLDADLPMAEAPPARDARPVSAPAPADVPLVPTAGTRIRTYVLVGEAALTLAALGVGIGFTVAKSSAADRATDAQTAFDRASAGSNGSCARPSAATRAQCAELRTAIDDHEQASTLATLGFVGAGASAVATVATYLLWQPQVYLTAGSLRVLPSFGSRTGLDVTGSF